MNDKQLLKESFRVMIATMIRLCKTEEDLVSLSVEMKQSIEKIKNHINEHRNEH